VALTADMIDNGADISITSQHNINVSGFVSLTTTVMSNLMSGGNILFSAAQFAGGNLTVGGPMSLSTHVAANLSAGAGIDVSAGGALSAQNIDATIVVDPGV